ncbi:MAG: RNA polymerase sigma factor [Bacteroidota bacterium]|nr:RNA polymerase sigma factor [Bacteroidota bacterium]
MTEQGLIEECKAGNLQSFRKLIVSTSPFVFSIAFRMLQDEDLAKDVVQETMVTVWQKLRNIKSAGSFKTWVYRIAVNKCYDCLRKIKKNAEFRIDDKTWEIISGRIPDQPDTYLENEEIGRLLNFMVRKLSPRQQVVFILSEIEEKDSDEVSRITGMTKTLVKANLYYARKKISAMMEKYM